MENETENLDSLNEENAEGQPESDAQDEKVKELSDKNRQLFERAKKAEAEIKELKAKIPAVEPKSQPTGTNYGELAYFEQKGLNHSDDVKVVKEEASRLNLPYTDILNMKHIQDRLQVNREERIAKEGLPAATGGASSSPKGTVEYWLNQGEGKVPMTPDGNLNQELAEKVVEARMKKEKSDSQFGPII